jgi:hypothetical protein
MGDIAVTKPTHNSRAVLSSKAATLATEAATMLVELARVPEENGEQFVKEAAKELHKVLWYQEHHGAKDLAELERGLRIAQRAYQRLTPIQTELLDDILAPDQVTWANALVMMIVSCHALTNRDVSPLFRDANAGLNPKRGRGRPKNSLNDPLFHLLVKSIATIVRANGGHLTLDSKEKRGTWVEALIALRPRLPVGLIKQSLPLSTIERIQADVNREPLDLLLMRLRPPRFSVERSLVQH